jgi:hypothetical protein
MKPADAPELQSAVNVCVADVVPMDISRSRYPSCSLFLHQGVNSLLGITSGLRSLFVVTAAVASFSLSAVWPSVAVDRSWNDVATDRGAINTLDLDMIRREDSGHGSMERKVPLASPEEPGSSGRVLLIV